MAIDGLTTSTLLFNWNRAERWQFFILALTLWLCGWCGEIGVFRHWPRRIITQDSSIKALQRAAYPKRLEYRALEELGYKPECSSHIIENEKEKGSCQRSPTDVNVGAIEAKLEMSIVTWLYKAKW
jgi:hypothetical protein